MLFESLRVWRDPIPRSGPENMAIDEALIEEAQSGPILRLYEWEEDWASLGYFQNLTEAQKIFGAEMNYVRRWTGGGIVDHREDTTYTLVIPAWEKAARLRGGKGYREIHRAVASALKKEGIVCELTQEDAENESSACFEKPVQWDVIGAMGKLAGAGQRRGKWGVLHQGSVFGGSLDFLPGELSKGLDIWETNSGRWKQYLDKYTETSWLERVK